MIPLGKDQMIPNVTRDSQPLVINKGRGYTTSHSLMKINDNGYSKGLTKSLSVKQY